MFSGPSRVELCSQLSTFVVNREIFDQSNRWRSETPSRWPSSRIRIRRMARPRYPLFLARFFRETECSGNFPVKCRLTVIIFGGRQRRESAEKIVRDDSRNETFRYCAPPTRCRRNPIDVDVAENNDSSTPIIILFQVLHPGLAACLWTEPLYRCGLRPRAFSVDIVTAGIAIVVIRALFWCRRRPLCV